MPEQEYINIEQNRRITWLEDHYSTFNGEMGDVKQGMAVVKTDVAWLKKYFWIVNAASIGAVVTGIINLIMK
jgi:hypothetical protein